MRACAAGEGTGLNPIEYTTFASAGGNGILAQQMAQHERLVHWGVRRQRLGTLSFLDALHEGRTGLWSAPETPPHTPVAPLSGHHPLRKPWNTEP